MELLAGVVVVAAGLGLLGLAVVIVVRPPLAVRFLESFASSARAHYVEQVSRLIAGAAMIMFAPSMSYTGFFEVLGWLITVTAVGLLLVPWQWHHRFAQWAIPLVIRHLRWYGLGAAALGTFILYGASRPLLS